MMIPTHSRSRALRRSRATPRSHGRHGGPHARPAGNAAAHTEAATWTAWRDGQLATDAGKVAGHRIQLTDLPLGRLPPIHASIVMQAIDCMKKVLAGKAAQHGCEARNRAQAATSKRRSFLWAP